MLIAALQRAKAANASPEEVKATINEIAPELKTVANALPKTRSELYAAIQALCAAIALIVAIYLSNQQGITKEQVDEIIKKALAGDAKTKPTSPTKSSNPQSRKKRLSRAKRKAAKERAQRRAKH